jgi:phosphate transport system substrate-binding protein
MFSMKRWIRWMALVIPALGGLLDLPAADFRVQGSDTMVTLAQRWAEAYMGENPGVSIEVNGGGTGTGIAALLNRTADIATCSRRIRAREVEGCVRRFAARPREYPVALDAVVIHVHASNRVEALDLGQLSGIFSGRIRNWSEVGGADARIIPYSRENSSGTYEFFKEAVLKRGDFAGSVQMLQGTAQVLSAVAHDPNGIGYGSGALSAGTRAIRIAPAPGTQAVQADESTVRAGSYPLSRRLFLYLDPAVDVGKLRQWIEWIRGAAGQRIVGEMGYFPLEVPPGR